MVDKGGGERETVERRERLGDERERVGGEGDRVRR